MRRSLWLLVISTFRFLSGALLLDVVRMNNITPQVETQEGRKAIDINRIWAEGDNQENSSDSRHYGEINQKLVVGVADYVVWPPWRVGKVKKIVDDERSYWA